jgi:hypothetical protein
MRGRDQPQHETLGVLHQSAGGGGKGGSHHVIRLKVADILAMAAAQALNATG